jgi:hypothetical protein
MSGVIVNGLFNEDALFGAVHTADDFSSVELQEAINRRRKTTMMFCNKRRNFFVTSNRW